LHARFRCPRAVAAAAKYAAAEIHRMRSIQPEGGFVAVAGRPAEDGSTRSDVRLVSNSGPRFKVIENPGFVRPTAVSRIGHVVGASETLSAVARAYGLAVEQVRTWNALGEGDDVHAGQRLVLYVDRTLGGSRADGVFVAAEGFTPATEGADAADQWVDVPLTDFGTFVVPASTPRPATTPAN
jgi:LysM repeat protein